jgi:hypothetical protein
VASGPDYTYCSGDVRTTVDYILVNQCASYLVTSSAILDDHPLNTSDHLPPIEVNTVTMTDDVPQIPRVNWRRVTESANTKEYRSAIDGNDQAPYRKLL